MIRMQLSKHKFHLFILLLLIGLGGCDLDTEPSGISSFWNNAADAVMGMNAAYTPFYEEEGFGRGHLWAGPASDDMIVNRKKTEVINMTSFIDLTTNSGEGFYENWQIMYQVIRRANDVLRYVPGIVMDASLKNRLLGEANFLCGFSYFYLAKRYGGVPFFDHRYSDDLNRARETKEETYRRIETYLLAAVRYLENEDLWIHADEEWGRPNLGAAYGLLAKVYLHWGKYSQARDAARKVIDSGRYTLCESYPLLFSLAGEKSDEVLFNLNNKAVRHQGTITSIVLLSARLSGGAGWYYFAPTQSLYNCYEAGDQRRNVTLCGVGDTVHFLQKDIVLTSENMSDMSTGYMAAKYSAAYNEAVTWNWESGADIPLLRYADVLLMHAEAVMHLSGAGPAPDKRTIPVPEAASSLNQVRLRAFGRDERHALTAPTFADLINERRRELAYEDERHFDLVRWGIAQEVYAAATEAEDPRGPRYFNPDMPHFPLPQTEIDNSNGVLVNNTTTPSLYTMFTLTDDTLDFNK